MKFYQVPEGYASFEEVEKIVRENLPEGFTITETKVGGDLPGTKGFFATDKNNPGKLIGTITIRQNSYNGAIITLTSTMSVINDNITVTDFVPSWIVRFLMGRVLGFLTNLIFPAIYGTSKKLYATIDDIIMKNFKANEMDMSFKNTMKNMFSGKGMTEVKKTSIQ